MGAASLSNQNLIHVSDGFAVNLKNHVLIGVTGKNVEGYGLDDFFLVSSVKYVDNQNVALVFVSMYYFGNMKYRTIYQWEFAWSLRQYHDNFDRKVNEAMAEGFRPLGPAIMDWTGTIRQTMVRDVQS